MSIVHPIETWFITSTGLVSNDVTNTRLNLYITGVPLLSSGQSVDLLVYVTPEIVAASDSYRNLFNQGAFTTEGYLHTHDDKSSTTHTHPGLNILTGGSSTNADSLHTHNGLATVSEVNDLISGALAGSSNSVMQDESINQLSSIAPTGAVSNSYIRDHTLLEHLDDDPVTTANLTKLMDGSNADCCHTHSFQDTLWSRSGTTLSPINSGDSINIPGAGTFTLGSGVTAVADNSFAMGYILSGGSIIANGLGSLVVGFANTGTISTGALATGSIVQGVATSGGTISATLTGASAQGYAAGADIISSGSGSFAQGNAYGRDILASARGSFAQGYAQAVDIIASADNAVQFGPGTNATANSLQVGSGVLLEASGDITGTLITASQPNVNHNSLYSLQGGDPSNDEFYHLSTADIFTINNSKEAIEATNEPTGFPNRTDSFIFFDEETRLFSISADDDNPSGSGSFEIWQKGVKYTIEGPVTFEIADTSGYTYIYFDEGEIDGVLNPTHLQLDTAIENYVLAGIIYWNANTNEVVIFGDERHGLIMSGATHHYLHDTIGAKYQTGFTAADYILNTKSNAALTFTVVDGRFYDEDLEIDVTDDGTGTDPYTQILNTSDALIPVMYRDAVDGSWAEDPPSDLPYKNNGVDTNLNWNEESGGAFIQTPLVSNRYMSYTLISTNDRVNPVKMIQGQATYISKTAALEGAETEIIAFGEFPSTEIILLYRFIMQSGNFTGDKNAQIVEVIDYRATTLLGSGAIATAHGSLSGLSNDDHSQYLLLLGRSGGQVLIGGTDSGDDITFQTTSDGTKGTYLFSELTDNGFVKTSLGTGALSVQTTISHNDDLTDLQGGDGSSEYYHLSSEKYSLVNRLDEDSAGLTFDGESIGSGGDSLWARTGDVLSPLNSDDDVELGGSLSIESGNVVISDIGSTTDLTYDYEQFRIVGTAAPNHTRGYALYILSSSAGAETVSGTGEYGGSFIATAGEGGTSAVAGTDNVGGIGGALQFNGGFGGRAEDGTVTTIGGRGGSFLFNGGEGGAAFNADGSTLIGGVGGKFSGGGGPGGMSFIVK